MSKLKWLDLIKLIVPIVLSVAVPGAGPIIGGLIVHGIDTAEQTGKPGVTKLAIAKEEINTAIAGLNTIKPGTIDAAQLGSAVDQIISTSVDVANLVHNVPVKK